MVELDPFYGMLYVGVRYFNAIFCIIPWYRSCLTLMCNSKRRREGSKVGLLFMPEATSYNTSSGICVCAAIPAREYSCVDKISLIISCINFTLYMLSS